MRRLPYVLWCQRDIQGCDPQRSQGVEHGVSDGGGGGNAASFTGTLHTENVERARCLREGDLEGGEGGGKRDGIVHQGTVEDLAALVVDHLLKERLADALGDGSMRLTFHELWHQHASIVVHGHVA